ncbi:MAG: Fic family protein [Euryarchaeota archaeon]|nr:Fic family protein [Euryarchaeota archaeon]
MTFKPQYRITDRIAKNLAEIERVRGFLEGARLREEWLEEMQGRAAVIESHYSTHIEGTELTLEQAEKILAGEKVAGVREKDETEVKNYREALAFVAQYLGREDPITEELIKEIHRILVKDVRGGEYSPGKYRKIQNYIINSATGEIVYTPPAAVFVPDMMEELLEWINRQRDISPILLAGIAQFQFVHIHPFLDGNGRTARLLSTLILYKTGYDFKRLFTLSEYYDRDRPAYYRAIQSVRDSSMDMTGWLEYFTEGLKTQLVEVQEKGEHAIRRDMVREKIRALGLKKRQEAAVEYVLRKGKITNKEYQQLCKVSQATAKRDLQEMVDKNVLEQVGRKGRGIYYVLKK